MNRNTIVEIALPKALYESIKGKDLKEISAQTKYNAAVKATKDAESERGMGDDLFRAKRRQQAMAASTHINPAIESEARNIAKMLTKSTGAAGFRSYIYKYSKEGVPYVELIFQNSGNSDYYIEFVITKNFTKVTNQDYIPSDLERKLAVFVDKIRKAELDINTDDSTSSMNEESDIETDDTYRSYKVGPDGKPTNPCIKVEKAMVYSNGRYLPNYYTLTFKGGEEIIISFSDMNGITGVGKPEDAIGDPYEYYAEDDEDDDPLDEAEKKNTHKIVLTFDDEKRIKRIQTTPTFQKMLAPNQIKNLKVGDNELVVNNVALNGLERMESMGLYKLKKDQVAKGVNEAKKKPSAGLTKAEKSTIAKKAAAGKDIGKKGKGFEKVAAKAAKEYGSKEAGKKVAAAAMWKSQAGKKK